MALRINTNISSMNAQRQLGVQNAGLNKSLERLSSGMRINRAADDAAGLAISETLRAQVRGMNQAVANSQDSINLIQTAEGGLNATTQILQRMREMAVQASNDTYTQGDREKMQIELHQLSEELTRISNTTQFNGRTLLNGDIAGSSEYRSATATVMSNARLGANDANGRPKFGDLITSVTVTNSTLATVDVAVELRLVATATQGSFNLELKASDGTVSVIANVNANILLGQNRTFALSSGASLQVTFGAVSANALDIGDVAVVQVQGRQDAVTLDKSLNFHIGQNEGQVVKFGVAQMDAKSLHLEGASVFGKDDADSRIKSQNLIGVVDEALRKVNIERARMGAMQNRLEHSIANLNVASENLSSSESRIRDADVAAESARMTKQQILVQAGTAMLAQANSTPQSALSLLR